MRNSLDKTDEQLMQGVQQGGESDFEELYHRYARPLLAYFFRMLRRDEYKAQDFLQELFTKILVKSDLFLPNQNFEAWIYTIASNMCKNEFRKNHYHQLYIEQLSDPKTINPLLEEAIDHKDSSLQIRSIVENLESDKKELFVLRFEQHLSLEKIAEVLEIKEGTVKSRIFYLKKLLAEKLRIYDPKYNN